MLGYQHIYHAGNFADVHKHALLVRVLTALKNKHKRLTVLETHAGRGAYDLSSEEAQKTGEFRNGIVPVMAGRKADSAMDKYLDLVRKYNLSGEITAYPGSPLLIKDMLRPQDSMIFAELHPGEYAELEKAFAEVKNAELMNKDGFEALAEKMPPSDRRGLAVIDPSYEIKTDYAQAPRNIHLAWKKWPEGVFFLWYPILTSGAHEDMLLNLRKTTIRHILVSEVRLEEVPAEGFAMYGSGIAIVNPPLQENAVREIAEEVAAGLGAKASAGAYWLDNMKIDVETGRLIA